MTKAKQPRDPAMTATGLHVGYKDKAVIAGLDVDFPRGATTGIIGPNGSGKSTLLKAMSGLLPVKEGVVRIGERDLAKIPRRELARELAMLPQSPIAPAGTRVIDLVALGRQPHQTWARQWSASDKDVVLDSLRLVSMAEFSERTIESLSGGQRQRVWIAMVLAQRSDIVFLDEPTTYLDLARSLEVLDLVDDLHTQHGRTVIMVLHDLSLACRYCDHLVVMGEGAIVEQGPPSDVITEDLLSEVFGLRSKVVADPVSDRPLVVPIGQRKVNTAFRGGTRADGE